MLVDCLFYSKVLILQVKLIVVPTYGRKGGYAKLRAT